MKNDNVKINGRFCDIKAYQSDMTRTIVDDPAELLVYGWTLKRSVPYFGAWFGTQGRYTLSAVEISNKPGAQHVARLSTDQGDYIEMTDSDIVRAIRRVLLQASQFSADVPGVVYDNKAFVVTLVERKKGK